MRRKEGITFLALMITIAVALILIAASIGVVNNTFNNAKITNFAEEMDMIEQQVKSYYVENRALPVKGESVTSGYFVDYLPLEKFNSLLNEINFNGDQASNSFYELDLELINITRTDSRYFLAIPSLRVYSLEGIKVGGNFYFSFNEKINYKSTFREYEFIEDLSTQIYVSDSLNISKKINGWSNKLGIKVNANMSSGEKLYLQFDSKEVELLTQVGVLNEINIDDLLQIQTVGTNLFDESDIQNFSTLPNSQKFVNIIKKDSSDNIVSKVKINIDNVDFEKPQFNTEYEPIIKNSGDKFTVQLKAMDRLSGVKEIRYEYFETYDRIDGNTGKTDYYIGTSIDEEYLKYSGKVASVKSDGTFIIELPVSVCSIKLVVIDNAKNVSEVYSVDTEYEDAIYYSLSSVTNEEINVAFYGPFVVNGTVSYSSDGAKYSSPINWIADEAIMIDIIEKIKGKFFLKVVSDDVTRIITIEIPENFDKGTGSKLNCSYNIPYIPNGFAHTEGNVSTGFVIQDSTNTSSKYNEFVWIPVDGAKIRYERKDFGVGQIATFQNVLVDNVGSFVETSEKENDIINSVKKYGGFYVARYEAGVVSTSGDNVGVPCSMKNTTTWTDISSTNAYLSANLMYDGRDDIASTLMTAAAYDTVMSWLSISKYNVREYNMYTSMLGNFSGTVNKTGKYEEYALNNIYDICGNVAELTTETYKDKPVFRGGSCSSSDENQVASVRAYNSSSCILPTVGYRVILYIK